MGWKCFLVEKSDLCRRSLRRYGRSTEPCAAKGYHNGEVVIDQQIPAASIKVETKCFLPDEFKGDPRWPVACPCGYKFHREDHWQLNVDPLYKGAPDGNLYILAELPPGAIWRAQWYEDHGDRYTDPRGRCFVLMLPGGHDWIVYGPSSNGEKWQVEGEPPQITVSPSIGLNAGAAGGYHGFVKGGVISEDVDGRTFPGIARTA